MAPIRREKDSLGEVTLPARALYGAQTQRALLNFPVSGQRFPRAFLGALGRVKAACAQANHELSPKRLGLRLARAIRESSLEVAQGRHDDQFPLDIFQTGSGTSTNMNANEVIANLSNRRLGGALGVYSPVHPNDHVNMGQSSNDIIPTAAHVSAQAALRDDLGPALGALAGELERKALEFDPVVKLGRTHLMDAVPVRLGQEFGGYARQVRKGLGQIERASKGLLELAVGGTATGTGLGSHPRFGSRVAAILGKDLGLPFREAENHFEAQAARDDMVMTSGALRGLACSLIKIANDLRWMGSGPFGGLSELEIPELQPGSSIMPGKVNPVLAEMLLQVAAQVIGNDAVLTVGGQAGNFELNAMIPVMTANLLSSIGLLGNACRLFAQGLVRGLRAHPERCAEPLGRSPIVATVLGPRIGYDRAARLVKEALRTESSVREIALREGAIRPEEADRVFDFRSMTGRGRSPRGPGGAGPSTGASPKRPRVPPRR